MSEFPSGAAAEELADADAAKGERFKEQAEAWIAANPEAWEAMKDMARQYAAQQHFFGIGELTEYVRWHLAANGGDSGFKCNHNYRSTWARRLEEEVPECKGLIRTRKSVVDQLM